MEDRLWLLQELAEETNRWPQTDLSARLASLLSAVGIFGQRGLTARFSAVRSSHAAIAP